MELRNAQRAAALPDVRHAADRRWVLQAVRLMTTTRLSTATDRTRWQQQALKVMTDAISKGAKAKLVPLMWQLGRSGCAGMVPTFGLTLAEQEQLLRDWAAVLGLTVQPMTGISKHGFYAKDNPPEIAPGVAGLSRISIGVDLYDWDES